MSHPRPGYLRAMSEREPTIDEFLDDPAAAIDALGDGDDARPAPDGDNPDEDYEHGPVDVGEPTG